MARKYYVICEDDCLFEGMTKEQTIAAIAEATGNTPTNIDDAFISKIVNQNGGDALKVWQGTTAEYNALTTTDPATIYIKTDEHSAREAWNKAAEAEEAATKAENKAKDAKTEAETAKEAANIATSRGLSLYTHTAGNLTGTGANGKFKATTSETISSVNINGKSHPINCAGESEMELVRGAWYTFIFDGEAVNFRGGGAGGLNFKIVGGTTAPASPAENTIWVNTDQEITGWAFDTTRPNYLTTGGVWIKTGLSSPANFNSVKKNTIKINTQGAYQWNGTTWINKDIKVFIDNAWKKIAFVIVPNTIDFPADRWLINGSTAEKTITDNNFRVSTNSGNYGVNGVRILYDFTNISSLKIKAKITNLYNTNYKFCIMSGINTLSKINANSDYNAVVPIDSLWSQTNGEILTIDKEIDTSALVGEYYIAFESKGNANAQTHGMTVEIECLELWP